MAIWYMDAPEVKYPDLFFEVSNTLHVALEVYEIEHTRAEVSFLRSKILEISAKEGINSKNYNPKLHETPIIGTMYNEIDKLYRTNLSDLIAESLKPYDYRGLPQ